MFRVIALASLLLLLLACKVLALGVLAGTAIDFRAQAAYSDIYGRSGMVFAHTQVSVGQKVDAKMQAQTESSSAAPGEVAYIPFRIVNLGNAQDFFLILSAECTTGWPCEVIADENADGEHTISENSALWITDWIQPDDSVACFARVSVPENTEGQAVVRLQALSLSDCAFEFKLDVPLRAYDIPVISVTSPTSEPEFARNSSLLGLKGTVSDVSGVANVELVNLTTGAYEQCETDGSAWALPEISLDLGPNDIFLFASDSYGNAGATLVSVNYVDASPGDAWKGLSYVSLPIIPDTTDPLQAVGFDRGHWKCYDPWAGAYSVYPSPQTFLNPAENTPGRGFQAHFPVSGSRPVGTIPRQDRAASVHLAPGWNLIGQPFISTVQWDIDQFQVRFSDGTSASVRDSYPAVDWTLWGWKQDPQNPDVGQLYPVRDKSLDPVAVSTLDPWKAYWVVAAQECDLVFPTPPR